MLLLGFFHKEVGRGVGDWKSASTELENVGNGKTPKTAVSVFQGQKLGVNRATQTQSENEPSLLLAGASSQPALGSRRKEQRGMGSAETGGGAIVFCSHTVCARRIPGH